MQQEGVWPFFGLLNTCASVVALEVGRWAHDQIIQCAWNLGALVGSSLVDMCAKCGNLGGCLEILQQDGISRCGHLEHHDWHMSNGSPDDENASTRHLIYTKRQLASTCHLILYTNRQLGQLGHTCHLPGGLFHSWFICRQVAKSPRCKCQFRRQNLHLTSNWETTESDLPFKIGRRSLCR